jgi:hypothetical protein
MHAWEFLLTLKPTLFALTGLCVLLLGFRMFYWAVDLRDNAVVLCLRNENMNKAVGFMEILQEHLTGEKVPAAEVTKRLLAHAQWSDEVRQLLVRSFRCHHVAVLCMAIGLSILGHQLFYLVQRLFGWF